MTASPVELGDFEADSQARDWADARLDATLLIQGDSTAALSPCSRFWKQSDEAGGIVGLCARFEGFDPPSVTIAADDVPTFNSLLAAAAGPGPVTLAVCDRQPLPASLRSRITDSADTWMTAPTLAGPAVGHPVEALADPGELAAFYRSQGLHFWSEAMLTNGYSFGIRGPDGALVCAAGVNFVLERHDYGHIGPVATIRAERGKGFAEAMLSAVRRSLSARGVAACGLLVAGGDPVLQDYYGRMGFARRGAYRFIALG